jgi:hypothetical protein
MMQRDSPELSENYRGGDFSLVFEHVTLIR